MCNCIERVNTELKEFNMSLDIPFTLSKIRRCCIEAEKINPKGKKKVRVFASFCPFCGEDYNEEKHIQEKEA